MDNRVSRRELIAAGMATVGSAVLQAQAAKPIQVGIIGLGLRSGIHFVALQELRDQARITALCDLEPDRLSKANERLPQKAATYSDYRQLIADKNVEAVAIITPGYLHHDMAMAALRAGKDVLLEKPLAVNYAEAIDIVKETKRTGRVVCVGMQRYYAKREQQFRQLIESGAIGNVRFITYNENRGDWAAQTWKYTDPATGKQTSWRNLKKTAGSSELEFSIHSYGFICSIVKSPLARLSATGGVLHYKDGRDTRDASAQVAEFANGVRLSFSFSCFAPGAPGGCVITGDKGSLWREGNKLSITAGRGKAEEVKTEGLSDDGAEIQMYREFFRDVRERKPSPLSPEVALEPSKIAFAAEISISQNKIVTARDFA